MTDAAITPQKPTEWAPTPLQAHFLAVAIQSEGKPSITGLCAEADVDRTTFYQWLRDVPAFKAKWESLWVDLVNHAFTNVSKSMTLKAVSGDVAAARLVSDLKGVIKTRSEVSGPDGKPIETVTRELPIDLDLFTADERQQYLSLLSTLDARAREREAKNREAGSEG